MEVRRLECFSGVAEAGSFSAAAERIGISQPSLSRQIALLEDEIGLKLFHRRHRGVALTHDGEILYSRISEPLKEIDRALRAARLAARKHTARIVLWMPPSVGQQLVGTLTQRLVTSAPDIAVRISEGTTGSLAQLIRRQELDIAIVFGPRDSWDQMEWRQLLPEINCQELLEDELFLVGSAASPVDFGDAVSIDDLIDLKLVLPSRLNQPAVFRMLLQELARRSSSASENIIESDSPEQTKQIVMAGIGYAILPLASVASELDRKLFKCAPLHCPGVTRQLLLVSPEQCAYPEARAKVVHLVLEELRDLVTSGRWPGRILF